MTFKDKTRCGGPYRMYATDAGGEWSNHGAVLKDGVWLIRTWNALGRIDEDYPDPDDLIPLREPSEAAVEAAVEVIAKDGSGDNSNSMRRLVAKVITVAYEIDFPEGGK